MHNRTPCIKLFRTSFSIFYYLFEVNACLIFYTLSKNTPSTTG